MLRWTDGFDICNAATDAFKYPGSLITFNQTNLIAGPSLAGPAGQALAIVNTASGESNRTRIFEPQSTWIMNLYLNPAPSGSNSYQTMLWARMDYNLGSVIAVRMEDTGLITIRLCAPFNFFATTAAPGTTVATTPNPIPLNTFTFFQLKVTFGTNGSIALYLNGSQVINVPSINLGTNLPDRITLRRDNGGPGNCAYYWDHYWIQDGQPGDGMDDILPQAMISTISPIADLAGVPNLWVPGGTTLEPTGWQSLEDLAGPNGEANYIAPAVNAALAYFQFAKSPCYGLVRAVIPNACAKPLSGSPTLGFIVKQRSTNPLGTVTLIDTGSSLNPNPPFQGYATYEVISTFSFDTDSPWTDAEISNAEWGLLGDSGSTQEHATQYFLEKLVDLSGLPFGCGQGSYGFPS